MKGAVAAALPVFLLASLVSSTAALAFGEPKKATGKTRAVELQDPLTAQARFQPSRLEPGGSTELLVDMNLAPGYHAYLDRFKVSIEAPDDLQIANQQITPVVTFKDAVTHKEKQGVAAGRSKLVALVEVPPGFRESAHQVRIKFVYQACTDEYCLFPVTKTLLAPLEIASPPKVAKLTSAPPKPVNDFESALKEGTLTAFLLVFAVGFLTCLTPCIYPMIPITLAILGARAKDNSHLKNFSISVAYVLGIAITYAFLGVIAASTGGLFGAALSSPWVVTAIALVFVAMGLSMFGFYEMQAPAFIRNKLGAAQTSSGYLGAFSTGLVAGVVASPCIGPVLVSVLAYIAQTGSKLLGFSLLFTFAIGMGIPFLALGLSSSWITRLPKAGPWMNGVKYVFGTIMIAMAIFYVKPVYGPMISRALSKPGDATVAAKAAKAPSMNWQPYSDALLAEAVAKKMPVLIDFSAEWCAACHEMDETTFVDPRIGDLGHSYVLLRVDGTEDSPALKALTDRYKVQGFPTYIFYDRSGQPRADLTVLGYLEAAEFAKPMSAALL